MKKFWEWMKLRGYGELEDLGHRKREMLRDGSGSMMEATKQALIGYMDEFISEIIFRSSLEAVKQTEISYEKSEQNLNAREGKWHS